MLKKRINYKELKITKKKQVPTGYLFLFCYKILSLKRKVSIKVGERELNICSFLLGKARTISEFLKKCS